MDVVSREYDGSRSGRRILGIVPARGASKRIPRKNLYSLAGKPLIAYSIEAARRSSLLSRTIVSTDDEEIRAVAMHFGGEVPFLRPAALATDESPPIDFVLHAVRELSGVGEDYDDVCILEPTAPLRTTYDIDAGLSLFLAEGTDSLIGLARIDHAHPARLRVMSGNRVHLWAPDMWKEGQRQQDLEAIYRPAGGLFACRTDVALNTRSLHGQSQCGYIFPIERGIDIDTPLDLVFAEFLLHRNAVGTNGDQCAHYEGGTTK